MKISDIFSIVFAGGPNTVTIYMGTTQKGLPEAAPPPKEPKIGKFSECIWGVTSQNPANAML